jgi:hypothetical protein
MTTAHSPFAPPRFTAEDFARGDATGRFDEPAAPQHARPRAPIEEPRSFMSDDDLRPRSVMGRTGLGSDPVMEAELNREDEILLDRPVERRADAEAAAPIYAGRTTTTRTTTDRKVPAALMIGVPAVVLLAGVGYLAMTAGNNDAGLSSKAPGTTATASAPAFSDGTQMAAADTPPPVNPLNPAAPPNTTPAPTPTPEARPSARVESAPVRTARARPAPAPAASASSASTQGVDASATLPAGPMPYSSVGQTPAPAPSVTAPVPSAINPAPVIVPPVTAAEPVNPTPPATSSAPEPSTPQTSTPEASETPTP